MNEFRQSFNATIPKVVLTPFLWRGYKLVQGVPFPPEDESCADEELGDLYCINYIVDVPTKSAVPIEAALIAALETEPEPTPPEVIVPEVITPPIVTEPIVVNTPESLVESVMAEANQVLSNFTPEDADNTGVDETEGEGIASVDEDGIVELSMDGSTQTEGNPWDS